MHKMSDFGGIEIFVDDNGRFFANVLKDDKTTTVRAATLSSLKSKLLKHQNEVMEVLISYYTSNPMSLPERMKVVRDGIQFRNVESGKLLKQYLTCYEYDPNIYAQLDEIAKQAKILYKQYQEVFGQLKQIRR